MDVSRDIQPKGFIHDHALWSSAQRTASRDILTTIAERQLRTVRIAVADPQGKLRGKIVLPGTFPATLVDGLDFTTAQFNFDSAENIAFNPFTADGGVGLTEMAGFPDVVLVPDPNTFKILPWSPRSGWILGDMYFHDGRPVPFDARHKLKQAVAALEEAGFTYVAGLEVEFHVMRVLDQKLGPEHMGTLGIAPTPPEVETVWRGYAYQCEEHLDRLDDFLNTVADACTALALPLRSMEDEMGPGQLEFTFGVQSALATADTMVLFRSMVRQIAARMGLHATFMTRPGLPNHFASGWHLHQSLAAAGSNAFASQAGSGELLSPVGRHFVGGLLEHAVEASVFTNPTVNGYKRRRPNSLAPDRATWGYDNRAAMIRVQGAPGDPTTHVENRVGEPTANPYLYIASQILSGLDGVKRKLDPGPLEVNPYTATHRPLLPVTLMEAVDAAAKSGFFRKTLGDDFIDWLIGMKRSEIGRFLAAEPNWHAEPDAVTAWEHREYFTRY